MRAKTVKNHRMGMGPPPNIEMWLLVNNRMRATNVVPSAPLIEASKSNQPCSSSVFNHHTRPEGGSSEPNEPPGSAADSISNILRILCVLKVFLIRTI